MLFCGLSIHVGGIICRRRWWRSQRWSVPILGNACDSTAFTTTRHFDVVPRQWRSCTLQLTTYVGGEDTATHTIDLDFFPQMVKCVAWLMGPRLGQRVRIFILRLVLFEILMSCCVACLISEENYTTETAVQSTTLAVITTKLHIGTLDRESQQVSGQKRKRPIWKIHATSGLCCITNIRDGCNNGVSSFICIPHSDNFFDFRSHFRTSRTAWDR